MSGIVSGALTYKRTLLMITILVVVSGIFTYISIAKENQPDISIPTLYVSVGYRGVSPEDADKLLVKPLQVKLESIEGIKEIKTIASEGHAAVVMEFDSGTNMDKALVDTREEVRQAKSDLPNDADEPVVHEINVALFPILTIGLSGDVEERVLDKLAEDLKDSITPLPGVLEVELRGKRDEIIEVVISPDQLEAYNLPVDQVSRFINANNLTVTSGSLVSGNASFPLKVEGLVDDIESLASMPIASRNDRVIALGDVALIRRSYKEPATISRVQGKPTIQLKVVKRIGGNIIETVNQVKALVENARATLPAGVKITLFQDQSESIRDSLSSLFNSVIFASLLVMLVIIIFLGPANALMVGLAIPITFLAAIMMLGALGFTLNVVVLFALIMSVGMIVDGSIVVTEYADKRLIEGMPRPLAYARAGKLMSKPIFSSTITTLAVFAPLLFWPDVVGDFMEYIPITVMLTLSASLLVTVLVLPAIGTLIGRPGGNIAASMQVHNFINKQVDKTQLKGINGAYVRMMDTFLRRPLLTCLGIVLLAAGIMFTYIQVGKGVEFFPEFEPGGLQFDVRGRGNLSIYQKNQLVSEVERIALGYKEAEVVLTTVYNSPPRNNASVDTIGHVTLELADWDIRPKADAIVASILEQTNEIPGIIVQAKKEQFGPPSEADVLVEFLGNDQGKLSRTLDDFTAVLYDDGSYTAVSDTRPLEGIDFKVEIDRDQAVRYGTNVVQIGEMIKLLTNGARIGEFIADDSDEKIDVLLRFPESARTIDTVEKLRIQTDRGLVPLSQFVRFTPIPRLGDINRVDGKIYYRLLADVKTGEDKPAAVARIIEKFGKVKLADGVAWSLRGVQEDQDAAGAFLMKAFGVAFFILLIILVTQFNSFYSALLILSAIILSVFGVFIGLMLRGEAFGIVMSGVGIIALSGIVVNNNIILIDFYLHLRERGLDVRHAILGVCADRLRPVVLTSFTTCIGLMPMVLQLNLDIINREVEVGAPESAFWVQLASAIVGGLAFATILTLVMTPCLLYVHERRKERKSKLEIDDAAVSAHSQ